MRNHGQAVVQALGMVVIMVLTGGFAVDAALYLAAHKGMQNAADAAALTGASVLFKDNASASNLQTRLANAKVAAQAVSVQNMRNILRDNDIEFGYVDPVTGIYNPLTFNSPSPNPAFAQTGGYNAVRVTVKAETGQANSPIPSIFNQFLGMNSYTSHAQAVGIYGGGVFSQGGLRPIYLCQTAWDKAQEIYGDATIPLIRFYDANLVVGGVALDPASTCGTMGPGNFGLADFNNTSGGSSEVRENFLNGYQGIVSIGNNYPPQTGNSLNSYNSELNTLRNNRTVIDIPLYRITRGGGSNATFEVSQIASFVITDFNTTSSNKYLEGYFKKTVCNNSCKLGNVPLGGGITRLRLVH